MSSYLTGIKAVYSLETANKKEKKQVIELNNFLNSIIKIHFSGEINCVHCGRLTRKSFNQGFCYPCSKTVPEADPSIVKPEFDQSHLGISRDMEWAKKNSLVDHYVYLAVSSSLKVGITRHSQIPTRWIDQGASAAIRIAKVPYRQLSGLIEVELKKHFADKTNWRKMLSNNIEQADLLKERDKAHQLLKDKYAEYLINDEICLIEYPVEQFPEKIRSLSLDKTPQYKGRLIGIKGQYLIFEDGHVFNVRKHTGYQVEIETIEQ